MKLILAHGLIGGAALPAMRWLATLLVVAGMSACGPSKGTPRDDGGTADADGRGGRGGTTGAAGNGGRGGTAGTGGIAGAAGTGGIAGVAGTGGPGGWSGAGGCPMVPATNPPGCHPTDSVVQGIQEVVGPSGGVCTPGLSCEFVVSRSFGCSQLVGLQRFVCCDMPPAFGAVGNVGRFAFVPGSTAANCPTPSTGQDPACALPLMSTCAVDGLSCSYQAVFGPSADSSGGPRNYNASCCGSTWVAGMSCPTDAGRD